MAENEFVYTMVKVRMAYPPDRVVLDDITLAFLPGAKIGVLGLNGAGKSTTVRILATLIQADAGTATVDGIDVARDPATVRQRIGLAGVQPVAHDQHHPRPGEAGAALGRPRERGRRPAPRRSWAACHR